MSIEISTPALGVAHDLPLSAFRQNDFHVSVDLSSHPFCLSTNDPETIDRHIYAIGHQSTPYITHTTSSLHQSATFSSVLEPITVTTSTSSYPSMSYPSAPASFGACPYLAPDHSSDLKSNYQNEDRSGTDYLRVDFNPIVESLNFVPSSSAYEAIANNNFRSWSLSGIDSDTGLKSRVGFGTQGLGNSMCSGVSCQPDEYCNHLNTSSEHQYPSHNRRLDSNGRLQDIGRLDMLAHHRDSAQPCIPSFDEHAYPSGNERSYNNKILFNLTSTASNTNPRTGLDLTRTTTEVNSNNLLRPHPVNTSSSNLSQACSAPANASPISNPVLMTPDSSTAGFLTHKFGGTSSDDGEISPTPTNSSSQPRTAGRSRKAAPTLATGRRNLKNEPVDPDEADRRMKRRERNRKSAQKCRERKVQRTQELQAHVETLQREINRLVQERDTLRNEARQFVTLLQLHCPGVALPYMSCLNENVETVDIRRESHGLVLQAAAPLKDEHVQDNSSIDWRVKVSGKVENVNERLTAVPQNDPYTHLPSMLSMQSHLPLNRAKESIFAFQMDDTLGNEPDGCMNASMSCPNGIANIPSEQANRETSGIIPVSVLGLASASSSSPGSNYDLSFTATDGPTSLGNQMEMAIEMVATLPTSARERTPMLMSSPNRLASLQSTPTKPLTPASEGACQKCEDWDHLITKNAVGSIKPDRSSPVSSSAHLNHYIGPSEMNTAGRCEVRRAEQRPLSARPLENTCFS